MSTQSTSQRNPRRLLRMHQIASPDGLVDVSRQTIHRWYRAKLFPAPIFIGGTPYWSEAEVLNWLDAKLASRERVRVRMRVRATEERV